jgi:hypothetical protein
MMAQLLSSPAGKSAQPFLPFVEAARRLLLVSLHRTIDCSLLYSLLLCFGWYS